jgi:tellurite resistance protein TehA-like permease
MERTPLDVEDSASRISAYVYGNILVLAALVPLHDASTTRAALVVVGTVLSTFIAHAFAESVGRSARIGRPLTRAEHFEELRDSVPVLTSGVVPAAVVGLDALGVLEQQTALLLAELWVVSRIAGLGIVMTRLRGEKLSKDTLAACSLLAFAAIAVVAVKLVLTH